MESYKFPFLQHAGSLGPTLSRLFSAHTQCWIMVDSNSPPTRKQGPAIDSSLRPAQAALGDGLDGYDIRTRTVLL